MAKQNRDQKWAGTAKEWEREKWTIRESHRKPSIKETVWVSAQSLQLRLTLRNHMDYSPPGSSSMGFSRQEYWSGLPCPPPGGLLKPGIKSRFPALQADSLPSEPPGKPERGSDPGKEVGEGFPEEATITLICKWWERAKTAFHAAGLWRAKALWEQWACQPWGSGSRLVRLAERAGGFVVETGWSGRRGQAHAGVRPF